MLFFATLIVVAGGYYLFSNKSAQDSESVAVQEPSHPEPKSEEPSVPVVSETPPMQESAESPTLKRENISQDVHFPPPIESPARASVKDETSIPPESPLIWQEEGSSSSNDLSAQPIEEAALMPEAVEPESEPMKMGLYLGAGFDFSSFEQAGPEGLESGKFTSVSYPSLTVGAQFYFTDFDALELQYSRWPGKINSGAANVSTSSFIWTSYSIEYQRLILERGPLQYSVLLGMQQHETPFLSSGDNDLVEVLSNEFFNASAGLKINYLASNDLVYEAFMRYQHPLSAKSKNGYDFSVSSPFVFDGSLGVSKSFGERLKAGVYWFGQYQKYDYKFTRDDYDTSGKETMLNSNIQLRLTWELYGLFSVVFLPSLGRRFLRARSPKNRQVVISDKLDEFLIVLWWASVFAFFVILIH